MENLPSMMVGIIVYQLGCSYILPDKNSTLWNFLIVSV